MRCPEPGCPTGVRASHCERGSATGTLAPDLSKVHDASARAQLEALFARLEAAEKAVGLVKPKGGKKPGRISFHTESSDTTVDAPGSGGCCAVA